METVLLITSIILLLLLAVVLCCHLNYRANLRHLARQLEYILHIEDTNQLINVASKQKDIVKLANQLNVLMKSTRQSKLKMKKLNQSFRQGITSISHDLRTPLTTASGYIQMLQTSITDAECLEYLNIIHERQNMVQMLLNQLFEYVRIESGEITLEHKLVDVKQILIDTLTLYYDDFNKKGQEPLIILPEEPCFVLGDEQGIKRIFSNILFNALTHGYGDYRFEICETEVCTLTFSNTSESIALDELEHLFDRFYTKDQSRNKKTTGLGLAIAKELTKQLGGTIEAFYENRVFSIVITFTR